MSSMKQQLAQGLSHEDLIARSLGLAQSPLAQSVFLKLYTEDALAQARALDQRAMREPLSSHSPSWACPLASKTSTMSKANARVRAVWCCKAPPWPNKMHLQCKP